MVSGCNILNLFAVTLKLLEYFIRRFENVVPDVHVPLAVLRNTTVWIHELHVLLILTNVEKIKRYSIVFSNF